MPTFKLDGREIPFEAGDTIIRAAHRVGVDIPHYCWHPGLSVAANCRMCLVEVAPPPGRPALLLNVLEWDPERGEYVDARKPKLQPACQMQVAEGMEVLSESSEHVSKARGAVQELLLLNHPVDCPICDQAGECRLQDYWLEHQAEKKRMHDEPVHKPKAVVFGPTIVYDAERCIVCTRCVRFCAEVAKDPVLDVRERGNLNEIVVAPGRQLDHAYTLMTEYVCPVGALTARDFRFKARVWFLRTARTVCTGCATGCNAFLDYDPRSQTVYRHRPRENAAVNGHWMCDDGMLHYRRVHENRVLRARVRGAESGVGAALDEAAKILRGLDGNQVGLVLSAEHSNEDNFALLTLGRDFMGCGNVYLAGRPPGEGDDILRSPDKNPNAQGATALCTSAPPLGTAELARDVASGKLRVILALGAEAAQIEDQADLNALDAVIVLAAHEGLLTQAAKVVLPASTWAECDGTFVNRNGQVQESEQAIEPQGESRPAWKLCAALGLRLGFETGWRTLSSVRAAMAPQAGAALAADTAAPAQVGATP
jgi:NADH-quinone oxidoreductase subunit G